MLHDSWCLHVAKMPMRYSIPRWTLATPSFHGLPHFRIPVPRLPAFRLSLRSRPLSEWLFAAALLVYLLLCVWFYFAYVQPWIAGAIQTRIGADSDRYWEYAEWASNSSNAPLISLTGNFLGPVMLIRLLKTGFAIMCFNFVLFAVALKVAGSIPRVNKVLVGVLFLANAQLLPALTTLNKEIFTLLAAVLTVKYLYAERRSMLLLLIVLAVSIVARWEQAAILLLFLLFERVLFRRSPWLGLLTLIAIITVAYPFAFRILGIDPHALDWLMEDAPTLIRINNIQEAFGFPLVVIPKIFMLLTGQLHSPQFYDLGTWWGKFITDAQNWLFLPLGCLMYTAVFAVAVWTGRMRPSRPVALLSAITLIISAAPPFTQPRYIYGVYTMLCIELARPRELGTGRYTETREAIQRRMHLRRPRAGEITDPS